MSINDINASNTKAFAIYTPNTEPLRTGLTSPKYKKWYKAYVPGVGGAEILTIRQLEERLNTNDSRNINRGIRYNFLSNLSQDIQDIIKTRLFTWTGDNPINAFLSAPLLAYTEDIISINPNSLAAIATDAPMRHSGVTKSSATQISSSESTISQISLTQVSSSKIYLVETGLINTGFTQVSATQISSVSKELVHTGSTQVNATQISPTNIHIIQSNANEISFPSSISLQQLFNIHNLPHH